MQQIARHIIFKGRVQGVGFRYTANRAAQRHGLTGFVRNLPDGTVEMLTQGSAEEIQNCLSEIDEYFAGYVRDMEATEVPADPVHRSFRITF